MVVMALFLVIFQVMLGSKHIHDSWPYSFQCILDDLPGNISSKPAIWMAVNIAMTAEYYITVVIYMSQRPEDSTKMLFFQTVLDALHFLWQRFEESSGLLETSYAVSLSITSISMIPLTHSGYFS